jgi:hypothetical protein
MWINIGAPATDGLHPIAPKCDRIEAGGSH